MSDPYSFHLKRRKIEGYLYEDRIVELEVIKMKYEVYNEETAGENIIELKLSQSDGYVRLHAKRKGEKSWFTLCRFLNGKMEKYGGVPKDLQLTPTGWD